MEKGGTVTFGTEQKARTSTTKGRTKMGEGMTSRMSELCQKGTEGMDPLEKEFIDENKRRIDSCSKASKKKPFGGKSAHDAACGVQGKVDAAMKTFRSIAAGNAVMDGDGNKVEGAGDALIEGWMKSKASHDKNSKERAKLAKGALHALSKGGKVTKQQQEALDKVGLELEQHQINKMLDKDTAPDGTLTGEGLGYILYRQGLDGGSLDECVKDVRGYGDNTQRTGLINTSTYGSISMVQSGEARVIRKGNSMNIVSKDGQKLMGGSFERGQYVSTVDNNSMTPTERRQAGAPRAAGKGMEKEESILQNLLIGQQKLLEKLITQTT